MTTTASPSRSPLRLLAILLLLPLVGWLDHSLLRERRSLGLVPPASLQQAPPLLAFITSVGGGFRGVVANALWIRAVRLQDDGKFFELYTLADWITKLQPEFKEVWAAQAWNMAWNVSRQFSEPADRWLWVRSGMELLRDEGIRFNPGEALLYRELAWIFQDKIGKYTDDAHKYYKQVWAAEMYAVLGKDLRPESLLNPTTDEARSRATLLRETYKLDPAWMKAVDDRYGPLDWRMPESHALYWADYGLQRCNPKDTLLLRRVIWQSMQSTFIRGRLVEYPAERRIDFGPNLDIIPKVNTTYEEMKKLEPAKFDYISRGQKSFLRDAIYQLYSHDRRNDAARWFDFARTNFTDVVRPGLSLDEFVVGEITGDLVAAKPSAVRGILEGILTHYVRCVALGMDDEANGHALLARRIHEFYNAKRAGEKNAQIPSLLELEQLARQRLGLTNSTPRTPQPPPQP